MAFFKFRLPGQRGVPEASGRAAPTESVEVLRQRARHRLIGAAVLVGVGVVGFPLLFDTQPRPVAVDIPIEIPDRHQVKPLALPAAAPTPAPAPAPVAKVVPPEPRPVEKPLTAAAGLGEREQVVSPDSEKKVPQVVAKSESTAIKKEAADKPARVEKPASKPVVNKPAAEKPAVAKAPEKAPEKPAEAKAARSNDKPAPVVAKVTEDSMPREIRAGGDRPVAARDAVRGGDDGNRARALLEGRAADAGASASSSAAPARAAAVEKPADKPKPAAATEKADKADNKAAADAGGRYIVQIGAFSDALKAREARLKLEGAGLKTYTQVVEGKDGKRIRVRVGPFEHRAAADKAASRIKSLNLPAAVLTL